MSDKANILLILNDDMGFSDLGCYGGEVQTPNLDRLAAGGLRFAQFYNTARCCPSRASLLTGLHPHQANVGHMMGDDGIDGYRGDLSEECATIAEVLKPAGYSTYMSGKWHITRFTDEPKHSWPRQRGFDRFFGTITGAGSFYNPNTLTRENEQIEVEDEDFFYTDAISDQAVDYIKEHAKEKADEPFFAYVAYTAPHWPLHAHPQDIKRYKGRFDRGWDVLREERLERMVEMGLIDPSWKLTERDPTQPPWDEAENKAWQARRMEVYAAQIDRMDQGIGRIVQALEETGQLDHTLMLFLADNGGCAEEIGEAWSQRIAGSIGRHTTRGGKPVQYGNDPNLMPGPEDTYQSYGVPWANVSNTPFREYKHWVHEGGIATPLIVHWPEGIEDRGALRKQPAQLPDVMATCLEVAGATYPEERDGHRVQALEGYSMTPIFRDEPHGREVLYWEHEGNCAVRKDKWKLVCKYPGGWELYDIEVDRTELHDLSAAHPDVVAQLSALYAEWAERCNVMPWAELQAMRQKERKKMSEVVMTEEQIAEFEKDGFVVLREFIPAAMLAELREGYDAATRGEYDVDGWNQKIDPDKILQLGMPNTHIPGWEGHEYLQRIVAAGKQLLGDDIEYKYDQLIYKPPGNPVELLWHQDAGYGWPGKANYRSATCWLALSVATEEMGSLQFLPGSHKEGIAEHVDATHKSPINAALEVKVDESKAVVVEYGPGDVTFHHGRTLHYSRGNSTDKPRRGLSTHLWPDPNEE